MSQQADHIRRSRRLQSLSPISLPPLNSGSTSSTRSSRFDDTRTTIGSTQSIPTPRPVIINPALPRPSSAQPSFSYASPNPPAPIATPPISIHSAPHQNPPIAPMHHSQDVASDAYSLPSIPIPDFSFQPSPPHSPQSFNPVLSPRTSSAFHFPQLFSFSVSTSVLPSRKAYFPILSVLL